MSAKEPPLLVFPPDMTLQAAARIARDHGCGLTVAWIDGRCAVATYALPLDDFIPEFLRPQGG